MKRNAYEIGLLTSSWTFLLYSSSSRKVSIFLSRSTRTMVASSTSLRKRASSSSSSERCCDSTSSLQQDLQVAWFTLSRLILYRSVTHNIEWLHLWKVADCTGKHNGRLHGLDLIVWNRRTKCPMDSNTHRPTPTIHVQRILHGCNTLKMLAVCSGWFYARSVLF